MEIKRVLPTTPLMPLRPAPVERPLDRVSLSGFPPLAPPPLPSCHRPLWDAVGVGASVASSPALAFSLLGVIRDLQHADLHFLRDKTQLTPEQVLARCLADPSSLDVTGADMKASRFPVRSLDDLRALDALYVTRDFASLKNPALAHAVDHMGALGLRLFKSMGGGAQYIFKYEYTGRGDALRDFGRYGAYQLYTGGLARGGDPRPDVPLLVGFGEESDDRHPFRVAQSIGRFQFDRTGVKPEDAADAVEMAWFEYRCPNPELEANPFARTLRDMNDAGYTFRKASGDRLRTWDLLHLDGKTPVGLCVGGCKLDTVTVERVADPAVLTPEIRQIQQLFAATFKPMTDRLEIDGDDLADVVRACRKPSPIPDLKDRWMLLYRLAQTESFGPRFNLRPAEVSLEFLQALPGAGSPAWWQQDVPLYTGLLQSLPGDRARRVFSPLRAMLARAANDEEARQVRDLFVALVAGDLQQVAQGVAAFPSGSPLHAGFAALRDLLAVHVALGGASPEELLADYDALERGRRSGQTLDAACQYLKIVQSVVAPREGWAAARDTFTFLQEGMRDGRFDGRTDDEALRDFTAVYLLRRDLNAARATLLQPRPRPQSIVADGSSLRIGNVRVPVRT